MCIVSLITIFLPSFIFQHVSAGEEIVSREERYYQTRKERVRKQMTKEAIAIQLSVSAKTYYNWINEEADIPSSKLRAMAKLFEVPMEYLIELSKEKGA